MIDPEVIGETIQNTFSKNIVLHHLASFQENDIEAVMADYNNESVFITREATYSGKEEIKNFFVALMVHFPKTKSNIELDKIVVHGHLAYIVWHADTPTLKVPLGTDTFIIKNKKIHRQTFAGQLDFI